MGFLREISRIWVIPFLPEEAGVCVTALNDDTFNLDTLDRVPPRSHQGFPSWDERIYPCFFFLGGCLCIDRMRYDSSRDRCRHKQVPPRDTVMKFMSLVSQ